MTALRFAELMATPVGSLVRALLGVAFIALGFFIGGVGGIVLAAAGLIPLAAGLFNACFIAPLLHVPFRGSHLEAH